MTTVRIMVVDDDPVQHEIIYSNILRLLPDAVVTQADGSASALTHLRALSGSGAALPDLIVSDLNMPGHSGWHFAAAVQADSRFQSIPLVMATTDVNLDPASEFQIRIRQCRAVGVVAKPIQLEVMKTVLRRVFPSRFPPVKFLVVHDEPRLLRGVLQDIRAWLVNVLKYPLPLTTNQVYGALSLLESDESKSVGGVIIGLEESPAMLHGLLQNIRSLEAGKHLPILVFADPQDIAGQRAAVAAGATSFISKPIGGENFRAGLKQVFGAPPIDYLPKKVTVST